MIEGGYLKNMGAISRGLEIIWDKKQFLLHQPLQLRLWLVPKCRKLPSDDPCNNENTISRKMPFVTIHNPADLLFSNLIGSMSHVDNKTNEQFEQIWVQNIWTLVESASIWTDPTELHFPLFYWFKRCTWQRELLCGQLVTSQLKHQTWWNMVGNLFGDWV